MWISDVSKLQILFVVVTSLMSTSVGIKYNPKSILNNYGGLLIRDLPYSGQAIIPLSYFGSKEVESQATKKDCVWPLRNKYAKNRYMLRNVIDTTSATIFPFWPLAKKKKVLKNSNQSRKAGRNYLNNCNNYGVCSNHIRNVPGILENIKLNYSDILMNFTNRDELSNDNMGKTGDYRSSMISMKTNNQEDYKYSRPQNVCSVSKIMEGKENWVVTINPLLMKRLHLSAGEIVKLRGRRRGIESIAIVVPNEKQSESEIFVAKNIQKSLRIRVGSLISVESIHPSQIHEATEVLILPFDDSLAQLNSLTRNKKENYDTLSTEFSHSIASDSRKEHDRTDNYDENSAIDIARDMLIDYLSTNIIPVKCGDTFMVNNIEFKVMQIATLHDVNAKYAILTPNSLISLDGDPLLREEDEFEYEIGYEDIGGMGKQLNQIKELIDLPLRHPEVFKAVGIPPPKGVLIHGVPGCGKTMVARAIATETGASFYVINGPEIMSKLAGESERKLRKTFQMAIESSPSIIFIDEIDSISSKRERAGSELERRIVSQLLTLLDGLKATHNVLVLAATNRPNVVDSALRRFGRFDREIEIPVPDEKGRYEILLLKTKNMNLDNDVDLKQISRDAHGFVGADISQMCLEAAMQCIREYLPLINDANLYDFYNVHQITEENKKEKFPYENRIPDELLRKLKVSNRHFQYALGICNPSALREKHIEIPDVTWEDVGGLEDVKKELIENVQYPVEYADKYIKYGLSSSKGVLFYGPPGCGKTLLAKAIANECNANFISIKGPELLTMWFGESEANVRELFDKARASAPCILFFDELDSIAKYRGSSVGGGGEAADRVINQILTEIDGIGEKKSVFIIAATNRPDILDPAIMRPGRLDQLVYIPLPDYKSRICIFKAALRKAPLADDVDIEEMARITEGFSGADITEICQQAAKEAVKEAIEEDKKRGRPLAPNEKDPVPCIAKKHFHVIKNARKSVSDEEVLRYEQFCEKTKSWSRKASGQTIFTTGNSSSNHST